MPSVYHAEDIVPYSILLFADEDDLLLNHSATRSINPNSTSTIYSVSENASSAIQTNYFADPELSLDNLCELKHHMLTRNARANNIDRRLQPNPSTRTTIEMIINVLFLIRNNYN